jgi:hypothetical protein
MNLNKKFKNSIEIIKKLLINRRHQINKIIKMQIKLAFNKHKNNFNK